MHEQAWVKVNAPVDLGMADLIEALSAFPTVRTIESCQGDDRRPAWVCFIVGDDDEDAWRPLAELVLGKIGPALMSAVGDHADTSVRVTTFGSWRGEISIRPGAVTQVADALRRLRTGLVTT